MTRFGRHIITLAMMCCLISSAQASIMPKAESPKLAANFLKAQFLERKGDFKEAAEAYSAVLSKRPDHPELIAVTLRQHLLSGQFESAHRLIDRYLDLTTEDGNITAAMEANSERAGMLQLTALLDSLFHLKTGDYDTVINELTQIQTTLEALPMNSIYERINHALHTLVLAWAHIEHGDRDMAIDLLDDLYLSESFLFYQDAMMLYRLGHVWEAKEAYEAVRVEPNPNVTMNGYYIYQALGLTEEADTLKRVFLESNTDIRLSEAEYPDLQQMESHEALARILSDTLQHIGIMLTQHRAYDDAMMLLQLSLFLTPDNHYSHYILGEMAETRGWADHAASHFTQVPESSGFAYRARAKEAIMQYESDRKDAAKQALFALIDSQPDGIYARLTLADMYLKEQHFGEAISAYTDAIDVIEHHRNGIAREHWTVFYARGICFEQSGKWPQAEADFEQALALNPNQPDVLNYLGYSWLVMGKNLEEAEELLKRAVLQEPSNGHIMDSYGWALYLLGDYQKAEPFLERAATLLPQEAIVNDHLGDLYWQLGRRIEANYQWQRALKFNPTDEERSSIYLKLEYGLDAPSEQTAHAEPSPR